MRAIRLVFKEKAVCETEDFIVGDKPGPGEILLQTVCSLVSPGTETNMFLGLHSALSNPDNAYVKYPFRPGYSSCCRVLAVGAGVENFREGDLVFNPQPHASHHLQATGSVVKAPPGLDPESVCYAKLMAISMNGVRVAKLALGEAVGVFGQGLVGLLAVVFAKMSGAYPLAAFDLCDRRLGISRALGADVAVNSSRQDPVVAVKDICPQGALDCAIEASGNAALIPVCAKLLGLGGRLILLGSPHRDVTMNFYSEIHGKQISIVGAHEAGAPRIEDHRFPWTMRRNMELALKLAAEGRIPLNQLGAHRVPFTAAQELYDGIGKRTPGMLGCFIQWDVKEN